MKCRGCAALISSALLLAASAHSNQPSSRSTTTESLRAALQDIVNTGAIRENRSYSFAVALPPDGEIVHVFAGANDRNVRGSMIDADSLFPAGSVTKTFLAVSAVMVAEPTRKPNAGGFTLDLDAPVLPIVNKWLAAQNKTTISEIWETHDRSHVPPSNISALAKISTRMLLSMTSGIGDYNDTAMQLWTKSNSPNDIEPLVFMANMSHIIPFTPGEGAMYSGNGFVYAGMVLAAATGAKTWEELDQRALLDEMTDRAGEQRFNHTLFMGAGPCSQYPHVVHQYAVGVHKPAPPAPPPAQLRKLPPFYDIYNESCLNGWTMGNIAVGPQDIARFYFLLAKGRLLSQTQLRSMQQWHYFSAGWNAKDMGMEYGMGLMYLRDLDVFDMHGNHPNYTDHWGHPGADWGSQLGIPPGQVVGYWPSLNASMALASNTMRSMAAQKNETHHEPMAYVISCAVLDAVAQHLRPADLPRLNCTQR